MATSSKQNDEMLERCAEICHECQDACLRTIRHCLGLGGEHASSEHQTILADCALICGTSHNYLHRGSARHVHTCRARAAVCRECADNCERMAGGDDVMRECAASCRRCAQSCEAMAGPA